MTTGNRPVEKVALAVVLLLALTGPISAVPVSRLHPFHHRRAAQQQDNTQNGALSGLDHAAAHKALQQVWARRGLSSSTGPAVDLTKLIQFGPDGQPIRNAAANKKWEGAVPVPGTRDNDPEVVVNPFLAPTRKPCSNTRSIKVIRSGQVSDPQFGCYRGEIVTFDDDYKLQDEAFDPTSFLNDIFLYKGYPGSPDFDGLIWLNLAYFNVTLYREEFGPSGADFGTTSGDFAAASSDYAGGILDFLSQGFDMFSLYITALWHDDVTVYFFSDKGEMGPILLSATQPTFLTFGPEFKGINVFAFGIDFGSGLVVHPGYTPALDYPFFVIDNVNIRRQPVVF